MKCAYSLSASTTTFAMSENLYFFRILFGKISRNISITIIIFYLSLNTSLKRLEYRQKKQHNVMILGNSPDMYTLQGSLTKLLGFVLITTGNIIFD